MFFETTLTGDRIAEMRAIGVWDDRILDEWVTRWAVEREDQPFVHDIYGTMSWGEFGEEVSAPVRGGGLRCRAHRWGCQSGRSDLSGA